MEARVSSQDEAIEANKKSVEEISKMLKQTPSGKANTGKVQDGNRNRMQEDNKVNETLESMKAEIDGITNQLKQFNQQANMATRAESPQQLEETMNRELSSFLETHRVRDLIQEIKTAADGLAKMQVSEQL